MTVWFLQGDVRDVLKTLPDDHFDCIVTSPPYWGLRDYGVEGQIGLEPTLAHYLDVMTAIMRECRRVLKPSGTCWLNIGDSYAATTKGSGGAGKSTPGPNRDLQNIGFQKFEPIKMSLGSLKPKDLCMVPNRLAIRLQDDGWWVRSEIIWHKPNPMPESVTDRPTSAHEKVWLLTKSDRYFYDADAIKEPLSCPDAADGSRIFGGKQGVRNAKHGERTNGRAYSSTPEVGRNCRNVWAVTTKPFKGAHFATMPPDLVEKCVKAGCPIGGLVLDPFGGAGTTGLVAERLGRHATLIELNPMYVEMAQQRILEGTK